MHFFFSQSCKAFKTTLKSNLTCYTFFCCSWIRELIEDYERKANASEINIFSCYASLYQSRMQAKPILNTLKLQRKEKRNGRKRTETASHVKIGHYPNSNEKQLKESKQGGAKNSFA